MSTTLYDESHLATIDFLTAKFSEYRTWTNEKRAVFNVLKKYLVHIGADIVYKNSMNNLSSLGSYIFLPNFTGWADGEIERNTAELRVLLAHSDPSGENKGKQFAVVKFYSYSSEKHLAYFKKFLNHNDLIIHDLWFEDELPKKLWEALQKEEQNNVPLEFSREDEGIGVSWYGIDITGDDELDQQLYWKLEDSAIELQSLGMYPTVRLRFLTDSLISLSVQN